MHILCPSDPTPKYLTLKDKNKNIIAIWVEYPLSKNLRIGKGVGLYIFFLDFGICAYK
jgi:hypothetical protein